MIKVIGTESEISDKFGSTGVTKFKIEIIGEGAGSLNFFYERPWELQEALDSGKNVDGFINKAIRLVSSPEPSEEL